MTLKAKYNLGVIGMGHWVRRLEPSIKKINKIRFFKVLDVTNFEDKKELLKKYKIDKKRYFQIKPGERIPLEFFEGIDAMYIASHNQFHFEQTKESLKLGKPIIVEKALATDRQGFNEMIEFITENGYENKVYPHLHYLSKALSKSIEKILPEMIKKYGKVKYASATFFEETSEEDLRRVWLLRPENGGIFLDWIHPIEILVKFCKVEFLKCFNTELYIVNSAYDTLNPSGVCARFKIEGDWFLPEALATIRVGKGFPLGLTHKTLRLVFEKNAMLDFNYVSAEKELKTSSRGGWELREKTANNEIKLIKRGKPKGAAPYDILVRNMVKIIEGKKPPLTITDIKKIYEPEWQFQEKSRSNTPRRDEKSIQEFIKAGLEKAE